MVYLDYVGDCGNRYYRYDYLVDGQRKYVGFRIKYDKEKVSKQTGLLMIFVDVGLLALTSYIQFRAIPAIQNITISDYGTEITIVALGICAYIIVIGIWAAMRGFKNCKNDGTKQ